MIRQMCKHCTIRYNELLAQLGIDDLDLILKERMLRWYEHVECSNGAVKTACDIQVDGEPWPGRPNMTWKQMTVRDRTGYRPMIDTPGDLV